MSEFANSRRLISGVLVAGALVTAAACTSESPNTVQKSITATPPEAPTTEQNFEEDANPEDAIRNYPISTDMGGVRVTGDLTINEVSSIALDVHEQGALALTMHKGKDVSNVALDSIICTANAESLSAYATIDNAELKYIEWAATDITDQMKADQSFPCKDGRINVVDPTRTALVLGTWATFAKATK